MSAKQTMVVSAIATFVVFAGAQRGWFGDEIRISAIKAASFPLMGSGPLATLPI